MSALRIAERRAAYALQAAVQPAFGASFDLLAMAPKGVAKLRELILLLAFRGRLLPQGPNDETATNLLSRVRAEKRRLISTGILSKEKPVEPISDGEVEYQLPIGWVWARLPELYSSISPGSKKLPTSAIKDRGPIPVVDQGQRYIAGYTDDASLTLELPGPVIIFGDHTTEVKYVDFNFVAGADGVKILRPILQNEKFFFLQLRAYELESRGYARHFKVLNTKLFAVAPLAEQARIVARVEELMQLCDALEAHGQLQDEQHARLVATLFNALAASKSIDALSDNWQRIATHFDLLLDRPEAVDTLEQTLLQLAVRGLLVPQDAADESVSQMISRIREEKDRLAAEGKIKRGRPLSSASENMQPFALPKNWRWVVLSELCATLTDGDHLPPPKAEDGVPFLVIGDVRSGHIILEAATRFVPRSYFEKLDWSRRPKADDILYTTVGSFGIPVPVVVDQEFCFQRHIALFRPALRELHGYLALVLGSPFVFAQAAAGATGIAQKTVPLSAMRKFRIPLPPLAEQHRIVARVEQLRRLCANLRERLQQSRTTQSQLADALVSAAGRSPEC